MAENEIRDEAMGLSEEELDAVAGGYIYYNEDTSHWEVINDKGEVVRRLPYGSHWNDSQWAAHGLGESYLEINKYKLKKLRNGESI